MSLTSASIALCGFMATGKTHLGRLLAERLNRPFVDVDAEIEHEIGKPIASIFADDGEPAFRVAEARICQRLALAPGRVVALGGGAVVDPSTRDLWQRHGTLICLSSKPDTLLARLAAADGRPLLSGSNIDRGRRIMELYASRAAAYAAVLHQVTNDGPLESAMNALSAIAEAEQRIWSHADIKRRIIQSPSGPYPIWTGKRCLAGIEPLCASLSITPGPVVVVTHAVLNSLLERVTSALERAGYRVTPCVVPMGETAKTMVTIERIHSACIDAKLARDRPVIGLGGGVIGDLAGFAAATYLRGVPVLHIPTTLLAMVDSSVGGKTGIDRPEGKNLIGAFHHPRGVLVDIDTLKTLPRDEFRAGMGEVAKHALLAGGDLLDTLESGPFLTNPAALADVIEVKARIVERDPNERGVRATLNLGHTFAHAIEKVTDYRWRHGDAVAVGLLAAAHLSVEIVGASATLPDRVERLLVQHDLIRRAPGLDIDALVAAMALDKKRKDGRLSFVLLRNVGVPEIVHDVTDAAVRRAWSTVVQ